MKTIKRLRKISLSLIISLILCMTLVPMAAFAYPGGLLNGKVMIVGSSSLPNKTSTSYITDNDEASSFTLSGDNSSEYRTSNSFVTPVTVASYRLKAGGIVRMVLLDSKGNTLFSDYNNLNRTGVKTSLPDVYKDVKTVYLETTGTASQIVYEWDIFSDGGSLPPDTTPPAVPTGLTGTAGDKEVSLSWTAVGDSDLAGYFVWKDGAKVNTTAMTGTSYTVTGLTNGVNYSFQVSAIDFTGNESNRSTSLSRTPQAPIDKTPPDAPANLVGTAGDKQATFTWTAATASNKAGYNIYKDGVKQNIAVITGTTYTAVGLTNGTTYTYTVKTVNTSGIESVAASNSVKVTPTKPPVALAMTLTGNGTSIIVSVTGGKMPYEVNWGGVQTDTFSASTHYIVNLQKGTTYTVKLTDAEGTVLTKTVDTGTFEAPLVPIMPDSTSLFQSMINSFGKAGTIAIIVIGGAVSLGLLVILAMWAWRLTKKWLASSK